MRITGGLLASVYLRTAFLWMPNSWRLPGKIAPCPASGAARPGLDVLAHPVYFAAAFRRDVEPRHRKTRPTAAPPSRGDGHTDADIRSDIRSCVRGGVILGHGVSMVRINVRLSGQHKCHWYWWR